MDDSTKEHTAGYIPSDRTFFKGPLLYRWLEQIKTKHTFEDIFKILDMDKMDYPRLILVFQKISETFQSIRGGRLTVGQEQDLLDFFYGLAIIFKDIISENEGLNESMREFNEIGIINAEDVQFEEENFKKEIEKLEQELAAKTKEYLMSESKLTVCELKVKGLQSLLDEFHAVRGPGGTSSLRAAPGLAQPTSSRTTNTLIVKNLEDSRNVNLLSEIKNRIDILECCIKVSSIHKNRNNDIVFNFPDPLNQEKFRDKLSKEFKETIDVKIVKLSKPKIIIFGIPDEIQLDNLVNIISSQNSSVSSGGLRVLFPIKTKNGLNVVIEIDPVSFRHFIREGEVYLGWRRCRLQEFFSVKKCSRCGELGHTTKQCKKTACTFCLGKDCAGECQVGSCPTCFIANSRHGCNYNIKHGTGCRNCPSFESQVKWIMNRTDYG